MDKDKDNFSKVCRVCANNIKDTKRQRHIFNYMSGKLLSNLKLITGVELSPQEDLPKFICERCFSELDLAIKFRERCIFSQNYLKDVRQKERKDFLVEVAKKELSEDLIDEHQLEYNEEDLEFVDDIDEEAQDSEYLTDYDAGEEIDAEDEIDSIDEEATISENSTKREKRHYVLFQENRPAKRSRNFFICEECGEYFNHEPEYQAHLQGHLARQETKKFFPCYQCRANFANKTMLRLHRREEHGSDRIFKCSTCGETFLEHGAKQRHEIAHANERPYPCLECSAVFASVSELRMHSATHSRPKFRCEPCNKDFRSHKLLVAHSNTKKHKCTMHEEIEMLDDEDEEQFQC